MEQQGSSITEIAGSVQSAAQGTQEVSSNIASFTEAASETDNAATGVLNATAELNSQAQVMREAVSDFLEKVKAAHPQQAPSNPDKGGSSEPPFFHS